MTAAGPTAHLRKTLTWRDGFGIAMSIPAALFSTFGFFLGVVDAWTAIAIWLVGTVIAHFQNLVFAEMASMFPTSSGGISRYAMEGWKKYFAPLGAVAAFGYWLGWSLSISLSSVILGELITATFFPGSTWGITVLGNQLGLPHAVATAAMVLAWALNYFGVKIGASLNKVLGVVVLAGLAVVVLSCLLSPSAQFDVSRLTWGYEGDWRTVVVVFYATAWASYGTEIAASFAPEYKDTVRDTSKAMRWSALLMIVVFFVVPLSVAGTIGEQGIAENPVTYVVVALAKAMGPFSWVGVLLIAAAMLLTIVSATADGGRALYGLAQEGMTLRQFDWLNRWGVPGRSLTLDVVINITIMVLAGSPIAILLASNFGYVLAVTLALAAFVLLRRDRPDWPRPIRRSARWVPVVLLLVAVNLFVIVIALFNPSLLGYGGVKESITAIAILLIAVALYVYRVLVQDKQKLVWRMTPPALPEDDEAVRALEAELSAARAAGSRTA